MALVVAAAVAVEEVEGTAVAMVEVVAGVAVVASLLLLR